MRDNILPERPEKENSDLGKELNDKNEHIKFLPDKTYHFEV